LGLVGKLLGLLSTSIVVNRRLALACVGASSMFEDLLPKLFPRISAKSGRDFLIVLRRDFLLFFLDFAFVLEMNFETFFTFPHLEDFLRFFFVFLEIDFRAPGAGGRMP